MADSVNDVRDHYDGLSFGDFSYGDRRAAAAGLDVIGLRFALRALMIVAMLRVRDKRLVAPEQRSCVGG